MSYKEEFKAKNWEELKGKKIPVGEMQRIDDQVAGITSELEKTKQSIADSGNAQAQQSQQAQATKIELPEDLIERVRQVGLLEGQPNMIKLQSHINDLILAIVGYDEVPEDETEAEEEEETENE